MIKRILTLASMTTILSGLSLPLAAQVMELPEITQNSQIRNDDVGLPDGGSPPDSGLPDGVESPPNSGLPDVGIPSGDGSSPSLGRLVILEIDGVANYYIPVDLDGVSFDRANIPVYRLDADSGTTANEVAPSSEEDGGFVIYPPADSVEDLEPEDILQ